MNEILGLLAMVNILIPAGTRGPALRHLWSMNPAFGDIKKITQLKCNGPPAFTGCEWQELHGGSALCPRCSSHLRQLSVLLTGSCLLSTVISSPCLLRLSLLKPWHRPFYTPGNSNRAHPEVGERLVWGTKPTVFIQSGNNHLSSSPQRRAAHRPHRPGVLSVEPSTFTGSMVL